MAGYTQYKDLTLCSYNLSTRVYDDVLPSVNFPVVNIPVSTGLAAVWNKYKNYTQVNKFVVGSWNYYGNNPHFTFNDNWNAFCREAGIKMSSLYFVVDKTGSNVPSTARIEEQIYSLEPYIKGYYPVYNYAIPSGHSGLYWKYNNVKPYGITPIMVVSNFSTDIYILIYDPVEAQWYQASVAYRTDIGSNDMWLSFVKATVQYPLPMNGVPVINPANPYPNIPDSGTSGGDGSGTDTSDSNPVPLLPSVSAIGTGMCRLYNPTVAQLIDLGAWLWGSGLDLTQLKKIFSDPMDVILGCSVFPVSMPTETTPQTIIFGNIDSQISSRVVSSQYTSYDLGQIDVTSYYNSYLDFAPYTKMQIYLPFIGMKSLNVDEFMSTADVAKRIGVTYSIDLLSGACVAHIYLNVGSTSTLLYEFGGTCNTQIPLNSRDYTATVQSLLGIVGGSVAAGVAAFMLPEAIPAVVGAAGVVGGMVMNAAKNTVASKPTVEHAGGIGGSTGIMGSRKAYLIIERPNLCHPENQEHFTGYPGFLYRTVNQLNGYTKFINFELQNIHATEPELEEIKEWFTVKGVLL